MSLAAAGSASGEIIGTQSMGEINTSAQSCSANPTCTYIQVKVPGGKAKAAFSGKVKSWKVQLGIAGSVQLVVAKRLDNGKFKVLRTSDVETGGTSGTNKYQTNLRIGKGQFIGANLSGGTAISQFVDPGAERRGFIPAIPTGTSAAPAPAYSVSDVTLKLNATLRH